MPSTVIRKILVPTDGSPSALAAADYAAEVARCTDAEVTVLHVAEVSGVSQFVTYAIGAGDELPEQMRETGTVIVDKTAELFKKAGIHARGIVIEGYAAETIIREASDGDYDLIVISSCGSTAGLVRRMVFGLGSVAERVVANAPCPTLVVRGERKC